VNAAIRAENPELLREYLARLPVDVNPAVVEYRVSRLAKLREFKAPSVIIENEERLLSYANGDAYRPSEFKNASFDELRQLLGTWCWPTYSYSLGAWTVLQWFLEPGTGPFNPLHLERPGVGDRRQSIFDKALAGVSLYPPDDLGDPIIRTCGSTQSGCFGYNPPEVAKSILDALTQVDPEMWQRHLPFRRELYRLHCPDLKAEEFVRDAEEDLSLACEDLSVLLAAYTKACELSYGVSCEYSL
jgi:hypothetical protein